MLCQGRERGLGLQNSEEVDEPPAEDGIRGSVVKGGARRNG
jgi:hypothetical protein